MEIRSYRRVFELERRLYRVDRLRLNPGGVPIRGVVYFLALLAACLIVGVVPLLGAAARALPWYLRDVALPGATAVVLCVIRVEGRPFHLAAHAVVRYRLGPRHLAGVRPCRPRDDRWWPDDILVLPDGSDARMRRLRYCGPGAVLVGIEHSRIGGRVTRAPTRLKRLGVHADVVLTEPPQARPMDRPHVISLLPGAQLLVHSKGAGTST
jgi:hypothetical protein